MQLKQKSTGKHGSQTDLLCLESTCYVFRTVLSIYKNGHPSADLTNFANLQVLNGTDMGCVLHSDYSCADIGAHIANAMREKE